MGKEKKMRRFHEILTLIAVILGRDPTPAEFDFIFGELEAGTSADEFEEKMRKRFGR